MVTAVISGENNFLFQIAKVINNHKAKRVMFKIYLKNNTFYDKKPPKMVIYG